MGFAIKENDATSTDCAKGVLKVCKCLNMLYSNDLANLGLIPET